MVPNDLSTADDILEFWDDYKALIAALELAVTAPTAKKSQECIEMAHGFALSLSVTARKHLI